MNGVTNEVARAEDVQQCIDHSVWESALSLSLGVMSVHFARHSLIVLAGICLVSVKLINSSSLGIMFGTLSFPSALFPPLAGYLIDSYDCWRAVFVISYGAVIISLLLFSTGIMIKSLWLIYLACFLFGGGGSTIVTVQRALIAFQLSPKTPIIIGICVSLAHLGKILGKFSVLMLLSFGVVRLEYIPVFNAFVCILSFVVTFRSLLSLNTATTTTRERILPSFSSRNFYHRISDLSEVNCCGCRPCNIPARILALIFIHGSYLVSFHVLLNFLPNIGVVHWHASPVKATATASLPSFVIIVGAPIIGLLHGIIEHPYSYLTLSSICLAVVFQFWELEWISDLLAVVLLSLLNVAVTTISLTMISTSIVMESVGITFAIIEIVDSIGSVVGNAVFGFIESKSDGFAINMKCLAVMYWLTALVILFRWHAHSTARR